MYGVNTRVYAAFQFKPHKQVERVIDRSVTIETIHTVFTNSNNMARNHTVLLTECSDWWMDTGEYNKHQHRRQDQHYHMNS